MWRRSLGMARHIPGPKRLSTMSSVADIQSATCCIAEDVVMPARFDVNRWGDHAQVMMFLDALANVSETSHLIAAHIFHYSESQQIALVPSLSSITCHPLRAHRIAFHLTHLLHGRNDWVNRWTPSPLVASAIVDDRQGTMQWALFNSRAESQHRGDAMHFLMHSIQVARPLDVNRVYHWFELISDDQTIPIGHRLDMLIRVAKCSLMNKSGGTLASAKEMANLLMSRMIDLYGRGHARVLHLELATTACALNIWDAALEIKSAPLSMPKAVEVVMIKTEQDIMLAQSILTVPGQYIGIDTETKPVFKKGGFNPVSIVQVSTATHCFIFDMLHPKLQESNCHLLDTIFSRADLIKVGVGLDNDIKQLASQRRHFQSCSSILDLNLVFQHLFPGAAIKSLLKLAYFSCGAKLSKSAQMSDWSRRPLLSTQIRYACLDAHIALLILDHYIELLCARHPDQPIEFVKSIISSLAVTVNRNLAKPKTTLAKPRPAPHHASNHTHQKRRKTH